MVLSGQLVHEGLKPILIGTLHLGCISLESLHKVLRIEVPNDCPEFLNSQVGFTRIMMKINLGLRNELVL